MTAKRTNPDFLNGVPELLILRVLSQRPRHGYDLVQALKLATGAALDFGEGCVYPILHRLEAGGLLACRQELVQGRKRVVYRVTPRGRRRLADSIDTWAKVTRAVTVALGGAAHGDLELA